MKNSKNTEQPHEAFYARKYPECVVNEITRKFIFKHNSEGYCVVSRDDVGRWWMDKTTTIFSYVDFVKFICDFVDNEMPKRVQYSLWGYRIDEIIDVIIGMINEHGESTNGYKPGLFVNERPVNSEDELKEIMGDDYGTV